MDVKKLVYIAEYFGFSEEENSIKLNYFYGLVTRTNKENLELDGYIDLNQFKFIFDSSKQQEKNQKIWIEPDFLYIKKLYPFDSKLEDLKIPVEQKESLKLLMNDEIELAKRVSLAKRYSCYLDYFDLHDFWYEGKIICLKSKQGKIECSCVKTSKVMTNNYYSVDLETMERYPLRYFISNKEMQTGESYFVPCFRADRNNLPSNKQFVESMIIAFEKLDEEKIQPITQISDYRYCKVK